MFTVSLCLNRKDFIRSHLAQLRNIVQWRTVGKEPKKDFNAHHDFDGVLTSHIFAAAMKVFSMDRLEDDPCTSIDTIPKVEKKVLQYLACLIVHYVDVNHCLLEREVSV